ncbi:MAG: thymidine phosphorylase [Oscillospiraceae bacterium]
MSDLIVKKRDGQALTTEEIRYMIDGYSRGEIPDYQMSAMTMAIYFRGMDRRETLDLTMAMMHSGETLDLSGVSGVKADKHSTGGVGDKTSLVLVPMVASLGVKMAKMSGRGLGHTGGTLDKLEHSGLQHQSAHGTFSGECGPRRHGHCRPDGEPRSCGQKLYALRDVTGTVASIPLIVSSIMSKKLAAGADIIVLDVKCGSGSFMKTLDDARELATEMVEIGKMAGRKTVAVITDMDEPLGHAVGNALEVKEAIAALRGEYKSELLELCLTLGSCILTQAGMAADDAAARAMLEQTITDGSALKKLAEFVAAQDGDPAAIYDSSLLPMAPVQMEVPSPASGYVRHIAATDVGLVSMRLGGGRATKDSVIDHSVGIVLRKKVDEPVTAGESLATIHAADEASARRAVAELAACYTITPDAPPAEPFIKAIIR